MIVRFNARASRLGGAAPECSTLALWVEWSLVPLSRHQSDRRIEVDRYDRDVGIRWSLKVE